MALPKAVQFAIILLVVCYSLEKQGYRTSLTVFFEELIGIKTSSLHGREKRATLANSTDYELQVVISLSELESLRVFLNSLSLPILINNSTEITSIDTTTVCSSNMTVYQCTCEESFAWSYNNCISHGACDPIIGNTCGCINDLPADNQYCQPNRTDPVDIDVVLELHIPLSSVPSGFIEIFRDNLNNVSFPQNISQSLILVDLNFTTGCYPNSTGGLQCHCEDEYAWSCDQCVVHGDCSNSSSLICSCINGLPPDREYCQPITSVSLCTTPTPDPLVAFVVLELRIPVSSVSLDFIRNALKNSSVPNNQYLKVMDLNFTTACYPNSTGGMQCHCEDQFAWSCDKCDFYGECSNTSKRTCGCINHLPGDGEFCQPITSIAPCSTPVCDINYINDDNDAKHNIKPDNHSASNYDDNINACDIHYINDDNNAKHNIKPDNHSANDYENNTNAW
ncbi:uncharacterized protein [Leuresthes tenuis]|uniref:uncharacterized protein n=1 Tax=Leuresthes tenuis TaxID=355514 RepID=UPI003B509B72